MTGREWFVGTVCAVLAAGGLAYGDTLTLDSDLLQQPDFSLDLGTRDLIIYSNSAEREQLLGRVTELLKRGYRDSGDWKGAGLTSSAAAGDANRLTGLGVLLNDDGKGHPLYSVFDGKPVDVNTILVKYTYNGDADLNGKVDGADYFLTDMGFLSKYSAKPLKGYYNGDFDYNGIVDGADYFLLDMAYLGARAHIASAPGMAVPIPSIAGGCFALLAGLAAARTFRRMRASR